MIAILMMAAKLTSPSLLKIKIFRIKGYDVITSVHDFSNKILSCDSNSSMSMREVIITSILQGFDQKKQLFWGLVFKLVQGQEVGACTRYDFESLQQGGKRFKTEKLRDFKVKSYIWRSFRGKLEGGVGSVAPSWIGLSLSFLQKTYSIHMEMVFWMEYELTTIFRILLKRSVHFPKGTGLVLLTVLYFRTITFYYVFCR